MSKRDMTPQEILAAGGSIGVVVPAELRTEQRQKAARDQRAEPRDELKREVAKAAREKLELAMLQQLKALGLDRYVEKQYKFHRARQWRLDFAWPAKCIALEVDGGTFTGGRHVRGEGYAKDCEKHAHAMLIGYRVFRATAEQVKDGTAAHWIEQAIKGVYE